MTPNDFLKIIQQETNPIEKIPDGWYCCEQISKIWGLSKSQVQKKIKIGKKLGYITEKKFLIFQNKKIRMPYYRFHEKENNQKDNQREIMENTIGKCRKNKRH